MGFKCGIVGLPNVGKSTLFNALTSSQAAAAANYPFCTIEPNVGIVPVPDSRLLKLAEIAGSKKLIPTTIEFVDIAGLVRGASQGEGLGNQFLGHIREVDAIVYMLRCFENDDIVHVESSIDPLRDAEIIEMELILADIESINKRIPNLEKKAKQDKTALQQIELLKEILVPLNQGKPARSIKNTINAREFELLQLLTTKPVLYVSNVNEDAVLEGNVLSRMIAERAEADNTSNVIISAQIESDIANLETESEKQEFLESIGIKENGLSLLIKEGYKILELSTFFTIGPKEAHAWTVKNGTLCPQAAGIIHTDFEKGFICAEVISYYDYIQCQSEAKAKELGKMRLEGKEYRISDGDIIHFRFNV